MQEDFDAFLNQLFIDNVSNDTLTLNYTLKNKKSMDLIILRSVLEVQMRMNSIVHIRYTRIQKQHLEVLIMIS